jgi:hypothetical protein
VDDGGAKEALAKEYEQKRYLAQDIGTRLDDLLQECLPLTEARTDGADPAGV